MALAKTIKKKQKLKKQISTEAIRHSYLYRQITMNRDKEPGQVRSEKHGGDVPQLRNASIKEVLSWEAT